MFDLCARPETSRYSLWNPHKNYWDTLRYIYFVNFRSVGIHWAAKEKLSGRLIGSCSFVKIDWEKGDGEIGYSVHPDCWHKGFGTEIVGALMDYGFNSLGLTSVSVRIMTDNVNSVLLAEKVGMKRVERAEKFVLQGDIRKEIIHLAITAREYSSLCPKK